MSNQCTIANKEVGVATHLIHNLNSTDMARTGNILNTSKVKWCKPFSSLNHVSQKKRFVANNGRCTLVTPIDKNTSGQPQPFIVLKLNSEAHINGRH